MNQSKIIDNYENEGDFEKEATLKESERDPYKPRDSQGFSDLVRHYGGDYSETIMSSS